MIKTSGDLLIFCAGAASELSDEERGEMELEEDEGFC
jgi:hypothetical protein